jgi:hypothetical protein
VLQSVVLQSAVLGRLLHAAAPHSLYVASSGIKLSFWCGSGNSQLLTKVATPVFREDLVPHVVLQRDALQCFTHAQMHLYTHTHAHTHAHTRTHIHTHTHAYAHTHAHAHTRTRKHTHHTPVHPHALSPGNSHFLAKVATSVFKEASCSSRLFVVLRYNASHTHKCTHTNAHTHTRKCKHAQHARSSPCTLPRQHSCVLQC